MHLSIRTMFLFAYLCATLHGQVVPLPMGEPGGTHNQRAVESERARTSDAKNSTRNVAVFPGDTVIPQVVDGGEWQTSMTFLNLENYPVSFNLYFFNDNGTDMYLPIKGQGVSRGFRITLKTAESMTIDTTGTAAQVGQGWAYFKTEKSGDTVGGLAVFKQSVPGRQPSEAVVPVVSQFDDHFVLLYDNTEWVTAMAIANPTSTSVLVPLNIRGEDGFILERHTMTLGPYEHRAFVIPAEYPITARRRGKMEFQTTGFGVGVLGLRFNGAGAFTSFHVLSNIDWLLK